MLPIATERWCVTLSSRHAAQSISTIAPVMSQRSGPSAIVRWLGIVRSKRRGMLAAPLVRQLRLARRPLLHGGHEVLRGLLHAVEDGLGIDAEPDDRDHERRHQQ